MNSDKNLTQLRSEQEKMASAASCDNEIARIIIFDLRKSTAKDCRFSTAAQVVQYKF